MNVFRQISIKFSQIYLFDNPGVFRDPTLSGDGVYMLKEIR